MNKCHLKIKPRYSWGGGAGERQPGTVARRNGRKPLAKPYRPVGPKRKNWSAKSRKARSVCCKLPVPPKFVGRNPRRRPTIRSEDSEYLGAPNTDLPLKESYEENSSTGAIAHEEGFIRHPIATPGRVRLDSKVIMPYTELFGQEAE